ncbi:MAG: hypothetical protein ABW133_22765 [Polyangiaceae bacterium]
MIKLKHVMFAPLLAMFAVMAPVGCSMETGDATEQGSDDTTSTESTEESNIGTSESAAVVTPKWKMTNADTCGEWCGDCGCEPTKRCKDAVPTNKPCSKRGDVCAKVAGNKVNIVYYTCK